MKNHLVEIYLDSYSSEPLVTDMLQFSTEDSHVCDWLEAKTGRHIDIEKQLRVEDVSHPNVSNTSHYNETTRLRVKLVP